LLTVRRAIVGGRNVGDIYFGVNSTANYRDLDVLPVVGDTPETKWRPEGRRFVA
jgi:hypothetical protein